MKGAGLELKGYRLHGLRHSCATKWVRKMGDLRNWMASDECKELAALL